MGLIAPLCRQSRCLVKNQVLGPLSSGIAPNRAFDAFAPLDIFVVAMLHDQSLAAMERTVPLEVPWRGRRALLDIIALHQTYLLSALQAFFARRVVLPR